MISVMAVIVSNSLEFPNTCTSSVVCCLADNINCMILSICFSSKVDQIQDIVTGNPTVVKMVVSFNRGARGHNALRQLLAPVVKDIIEDKNLGINTNPVDVYKAWVNQLETATGEARYGENTVCQNIADSDGCPLVDSKVC